MHTKKWGVDVFIDEHDGTTHATARLHTLDTDRLVGIGQAKLNPADLDVPEIGDELAVARALADLSQRLLREAAGDIEAVLHQPAHPHG
jgi:hypothetical protein